MTAAETIAALTAAVVTRVPAGSVALRFITRACSACGTVTSVAATRCVVDVAPYSAAVTGSGALLALDPRDRSRVIVACRGCGASRIAHPVIGKVNEHKACNAKCMSATRHVCDCECGGLNHGAAHA